MKKLLIVAIVSSLLMFPITYGSEIAAKTTENLKSTKPNDAKKKLHLKFFLNPNGYPCQMQDKILKNNFEKIDDKYEVEYIKTTVPSDREKFYQYGIRSLPSIIISDESGKVVKRFAPGIKNIDELMNVSK